LYSKDSKIILLSEASLKPKNIVVNHEIFHALLHDANIENRIKNNYQDLESLIQHTLEKGTRSKLLNKVFTKTARYYPPDGFINEFCKEVVCDLFAYYYSGEFTRKTNREMYNLMENIIKSIEEECNPKNKTDSSLQTGGIGPGEKPGKRALGIPDKDPSKMPDGTGRPPEQADFSKWNFWGNLS
ncbi:MAG: hypothetical protein ABIH00_01080, partial [Armatimonadota bacterium]